MKISPGRFRAALLACFIAVLFSSSFAHLALGQEPPPVDVKEEFEKSVFFGKKFADLGEFALAHEHYAKADALNPDQPAVLYNLGVLLARSGRYAEAQVKVDRYLQLFPEGEEKANVARLQLELEFQRELQKKRQADQEYADLFNRARFTYTRGELAESLRLFGEAETVRPADPAAVYNQAVVLEKQGDLDDAIRRYRRYLEIEDDSERRGRASEHLLALEHEVEDMRTKIVCSFCGRKLPADAMWCERCWHGPYPVKSAVWNSRSCLDGGSATRTTYFADQRFHRNEDLPCLWRDGSMLESLRYSAARQRAIQDARKAEGWTYAGDVIQGNGEIRYHQGPEVLEKVTASSGGEILSYLAHAAGAGKWLLDREDLVIDATRYASRYAYDAGNRITQQSVEYQNTASCNHLVAMTADFAWAGSELQSTVIQGGYEGFEAEGAPRTAWQAKVAYGYDDRGRLVSEELAVTSFEKTYMKKAQGELRDEVSRLYPGMRVKRPIDSVLRVGDLCAATGTTVLANPIDLRPFYAVSPNLGVQLPNGVTRANVTFTYPP